MELEWQRTNEIEQRRKIERKIREEVCYYFSRSFSENFFSLQKERETEHYLLPGGVITQAEPRPQAYAPSDDADIQIARPYGSHAPFKPR